MLVIESYEVVYIGLECPTPCIVGMWGEEQEK